jgi:stage III sporulation protein SpoIIIAA
VCRTVAARGVLLVATAYGSSLSDLLSSPDLCDLVGGVKVVNLGHHLASSSNGGHKVWSVKVQPKHISNTSNLTWLVCS